MKIVETKKISVRHNNKLVNCTELFFTSDITALKKLHSEAKLIAYQKNKKLVIVDLRSLYRNAIDDLGKLNISSDPWTIAISRDKNGIYPAWLLGHELLHVKYKLDPMKFDNIGTDNAKAFLFKIQGCLLDIYVNRQLIKLNIDVLSWLNKRMDDLRLTPSPFNFILLCIEIFTHDSYINKTIKDSASINYNNYKLRAYKSVQDSLRIDLPNLLHNINKIGCYPQEKYEKCLRYLMLSNELHDIVKLKDNEKSFIISEFE